MELQNTNRGCETALLEASCEGPPAPSFVKFCCPHPCLKQWRIFPIPWNSVENLLGKNAVKILPMLPF